MSCDKKVPRQALGGELGLAGNFPPHATVITNALQSLAGGRKAAGYQQCRGGRVGVELGIAGDELGIVVVRSWCASRWGANVTNFAPTL